MNLKYVIKPQHWNIACLVAMGKPTKIISDELAIPAGTVSNARVEIQRVTRTRNAVELAHLMLQQKHIVNIFPR